MVPSKDHLVSFAPIEIWTEAAKQAKRSDHKRHRTGCVIFYGNTIFAKGCSHTHGGGLKIRSIHAEMDAISQLPSHRGRSIYYDALVVTLTKGNNFASVSKPCSGCAKLLANYVATVTFAERANDESWMIQRRKPSDLENCSATRYVSESAS